METVVAFFEWKLKNQNNVLLYYYILLILQTVEKSGIQQSSIF